MPTESQRGGGVREEMEGVCGGGEILDQTENGIMDLRLLDVSCKQRFLVWFAVLELGNEADDVKDATGELLWRGRRG